MSASMASLRKNHANLGRRLAHPCGFALPFLIIFCSSVQSPAASSCSATAPGLVGWWPADGAANDIVSTNNGLLQGGAVANGIGMVGSAFSFDGTNGYVQIADSPALKPTNLTIEAWVRFTSLDSAGSGGSPAGPASLRQFRLPLSQR